MCVKVQSIAYIGFVVNADIITGINESWHSAVQFQYVETISLIKTPAQLSLIAVINN